MGIVSHLEFSFLHHHYQSEVLSQVINANDTDSLCSWRIALSGSAVSSPGISTLYEWYHSNEAKQLKARSRLHDNFMRWRWFPRYWPFVRGIHQCLVDIPPKTSVTWALMFPLVLSLTDGWKNSQVVGDLIRHESHCDGILMDSWNTVYVLEAMAIGTYNEVSKRTPLLCIQATNTMHHQSTEPDKI